MLSNKNAFTLIELLVVVLIIGILAAVALPQYNKAVEKSRATQALALLRTAYEHAAVYYMTNGTYPNSFDDMEMEVPWPTTTSNSLQWMQANPSLLKETRSDGTWSFQLYHAQNGALNIYIALVKGKYAGAGFVTPVVNSAGQLAPLAISCAERKDTGITFEQDPGDYCEKIMNGKDVSTPGNTFRSYTLP